MYFVVLRCLSDHVVRCGMHSCQFERRCERMQNTLPMTFIVATASPRPPQCLPHFPSSSSSSSSLSGSMPICICDALLLWPRFRLKKLAFLTLRITPVPKEPSHSPPFVDVGSSLGLSLPRWSGQGSVHGVGLLSQVAKMCNC